MVQEMGWFRCNFRSPKLKVIILQLPALPPPSSQGFGFGVLSYLGSAGLAPFTF